ncbi:hypothetical protein CHU95_00855 [Niveispirillum lacus]|uniref:Uncharacterized protein n=1 Tax=Niveispirillum lacus TaxID=1981099 RepID=A0A255Z863_9PROT|nr:transporter substrate-binding domain-containing protein [Niveispirillum lacus]OYQ37611.1 hypothetical protein CHU95_00855 [Niveispirillum lacus]
MRPLNRRDLFSGASAGLLLSGSRVQAQAPGLTCGVMDTPPWMLEGDALPGIGVDMVSLLARHAGLTITPHFAPPVRMVKALVAGLIDMLAYVQMPELDKAARSLGSIGNVDMGVVTRPDFRPAVPQDLAGCTLGMMRGNKRDAIMDRLSNVTPVEVRDLSHGLSMIAAHRLDALLGSRLALAWHIHQAGLGSEALGPFLLLAREQMMLYLTLARPYTEDTVTRLTMAAAGVNGQVDELAIPYLERL